MQAQMDQAVQSSRFPGGATVEQRREFALLAAQHEFLENKMHSLSVDGWLRSIDTGGPLEPDKSLVQGRWTVVRTLCRLCNRKLFLTTWSNCLVELLCLPACVIIGPTILVKPPGQTAWSGHLVPRGPTRG